jgi:hypothetical protein
VLKRRDVISRISINPSPLVPGFTRSGYCP